ncbi:hypothetical protein [Carnimonas bestiolae]|uniref:hypothetical protein n=1 Tax=Carnimonas bestiolae TaxID=3402172 RepID=UPI003F4AB104
MDNVSILILLVTFKALRNAADGLAYQAIYSANEPFSRVGFHYKEMTSINPLA